MITKYIMTAFCAIPLNILLSEYLPPHAFYIDISASCATAMFAWIFTSTFKWESDDA